MSILVAPFPALSSEAAVRGDRIDILAAVRDDDVALSIWHRTAPPWAASLDLDSVDDVAARLDDDHMLVPVLVEAGYPDDLATLMADDIGLLARELRRLTRATAVRMRLDVVETDGCRRFHADYVTLRLLCSYRGTGTQWCLAETPDAVQQLPAGSVGVFKGRLAMEAPRVLHRSPPVMATRGQRLLLVLDPA